MTETTNAFNIGRKPHITCGRDSAGAYTIHIDGIRRGRFATPEMMQVHLAALLAEKVRRLNDGV